MAVFNVTTYAELAAALAAAGNGDTINLAAGIYTGPLTIGVSVTLNGTSAAIVGAVSVNAAGVALNTIDVSQASFAGTAGATITGTGGADVINGGPNAETINGADGDDFIRGGGGNDTLDGGAGNDTLDYSDLTNAVQVNLINGQVNAGAQGGNDTISNFENVLLGSGNDQFIGSEGENNVVGGAGDDQIDGRGGLDTFIYSNIAATDGMAQQIFNVLRINAGSAGTDTIQNIERVQFVNGLDVLNVIVDAAGNALVASRDDADAMNEGDVSITRNALAGVLSNDVNLDQGAGDQKVVAAVNGSAANVGQPIIGLYGTLTLNADGSYVYVQNQAATNSLRAGQTVTDTFNYQADDGDTGDSAAANLVITITGVNDLPTLGGTQTGSVTEDTGVVAGNLVATGTLTVSDPDQNESAYQPQTTAGTAGTFVLAADGSWTYTALNSALVVQRLGAGQTLTENFTALSVDGTSIPVTVTVNGTNDNPVITGTTFETIAPNNTPGLFTIASGSANGSFATAFNIDANYVLTNNPDIYNSTTAPHVTVRASTVSEVDYYSFTVTTAGLVTFDIDRVTGYNGGFGAGDTLIALYRQTGNTATFLAQNDDSSVTDPGSSTILNSFLQYNITPGTYYIVVGQFPGLSLGTGTYDLNISLDGGTFGRPNNVLTETNAALSTSGNVTFTDVDLNDAPVASYNSATGFSYTIANGSPLTTAQQTALASAFSISSAGAFTFNTGTSPDFLGHDDVLTLTYTVTVNDQHGGSATTPVTITINGTNDAPVITSTAQGATLTETNAALTASGAVTASDVDNGDTQTYTLTGTGVVTTGTTLTMSQESAIRSGFTLNPSGSWTYNLASPDFLPAGSQVTLTETVTVSDGHGGTTTQNVVIVINGANDAPTVQTNVEHSYSQTLVETNAALTDSGQVIFSDVDNGSTPSTSYSAATDASVTATGLTLTTDQTNAIIAAFSLSGTAGNYNFNLPSPDYLAAGDTVTATFNVHVVDGNGGDTVQAITYTIQGTNDAPVLTGGSLGTIADTVAPDTFAPLTGSIAGAATDVDNHDTKTFSIAGGEGGSPYGTLTLNADGTYSFDVNNAAVNGLLTGDTRTVTYSIIVTDSGGLSSTADFTITITGQNENPVFATSPLQFFTSDNSGTQTFDLLQGASDPDNVEFPDLDLGAFSYTGYSLSGPPLTNGQANLLYNAIFQATQNTGFNVENGTLTFDTSLFDFLDENQNIVLNFSYEVVDTNGGSATQTASVTIFGALENNIEGGPTPFDDYINTADGNYAGRGQFGDFVYADDGDDTVYTNAGADVVYGGEGDDYVDAGSGDDFVAGGAGDDHVIGGSGNDTLYGDNEFLFGGEGVPGSDIGDNLIEGGSGNDAIYGGLGNNTINAGSGNDDIYIGSAGFLFGGEGGRAQAGDKVQAIGLGGEGGIAFDLPSGINLVDGGSGFDTVHLSGQWSEYTITRTAANTYVFERLNEDGTVESNLYKNVEYFVFDGGEGTAAMLANDGPRVAATVTFSTPEIPQGDTVPAEGVLIGNVGATDADEPLGDALRYFIDGSGVNNFTIDEDGNLLLVNPLDYEAGPRVYTLSLLVVDSRGAQATSTITVNITNVVEAIGPVSVTGALTTAELAAAGTVVGTAAVSGADAGAVVTYALTDSAGGRFTIDGTTGVITVANGNSLDFEQATSHSITVQATGAGGSTTSTTTTVAVTDVSPETIVGTSANETFVAGAGVDRYTTNVTTGGADSVNLGAGIDIVTVNAAAPTQVRVTFTSAEVGNGQANDSNTLANQDGGLAVRVQAEDGADGLTGPVTRTDDEGMVYVGGTGVTFDVRDLPSGVSRGNAFEVVSLGTSGNDVLTAVQAARPYYFNGGMGNDTITGGTANDFLVGGGGDDVLSGGAGNNSYIGGMGIDTVNYSLATGAIYIDLIGSVSNNGFGGQDTFLGGIENVTGSAQSDIIIGDNGNNVLTGGGGNDYLIGRDGNDTLVGNAAAPSTLQGGTGDDVYIVSNAGDSTIEFLGEGVDTVRTTLSTYTLGSNVENLVYTGAGSFTGSGNGLANTLTGGTGNDTLTGGAGSDTFTAIANNGLDRITDFTSGADKILLDSSYTHTATVDFVSGAGAQSATSTNSTFLYDTSTGILSYDADGTGAGAAVQLFNLGAGTALVASDLVFPVLP